MGRPVPPADDRGGVQMSVHARKRQRGNRFGRRKSNYVIQGTKIDIHVAVSSEIFDPPTDTYT
jgi:hypothetical protein